MNASLWSRVVVSRLVAIGAGVAGALVGPRKPALVAFDPHNLDQSLGSVGNILAASTDRWDAIHYLTIASGGYATRGDVVFFPFYSLLIHAVGWIVGSDVVAALLISVVSFVIGLELLRRLAIAELGERAGAATVLLVAFSPLSFFFTAIYTESLFLAFSVGVFYLGREGRFVLAGIAATAAALTHVEGAALAVPLGLMYLQQHHEQPKRYPLRLSEAAAMVAPLLAPLGFMVFLRTRGYGWLTVISGQSSAANDRHFDGPLYTLLDAVRVSADSVSGQLSHAGSLLAWVDTAGFQEIVQLVVVAICVAALVAVRRRLPKPYFVYSALVLFVFTSSPNGVDPLESIDRFVLVLFPLWMAAAAWLSERRLLRAAIIVSSLLLCFYAFDFGRWLFVG